MTVWKRLPEVWKALPRILIRIIGRFVVMLFSHLLQHLLHGRREGHTCKSQVLEDAESLVGDVEPHHHVPKDRLTDCLIQQRTQQNNQERESLF